MSVLQDNARDELEARLVEITLSVINKDRETDFIKELGDDTLSVELNSINYIELIVGIETEFGIEFDDEYLDFGKFSSPGTLTDYVYEKISELN